MFNLAFWPCLITVFYKSITIVHFCNFQHEKIVLPTRYMFCGKLKLCDDDPSQTTKDKRDSIDMM